MTELRTGRFTALLPEPLRSREAEALAYAVGRQVERLLAWADGVPFYACLASAPEAVLDHLAVELRAPAYRDTFPLEVKRALIRDALLAYAKMGTPAAVERLIRIVFGNGQVTEWYEYGGKPHHFRVCVGEAGQVSIRNLTEFQQLLDSVKRLSSWLDLIFVTKRPMNSMSRVGGAFGTMTALPIPEAPDGMKWKDGARFGGAAAALSVLPVPERD